MENSTATKSTPNNPQNTGNVPGNTATTTINQKKMLYGINMLKHVVKKGGQESYFTSMLNHLTLSQTLIKQLWIKRERFQVKEYHGAFMIHA
jgi:hypothetical protein